MCFGSVGTDTGGSVRIPSAACGTVGLKPTSNELSCEGVVALSSTLDHVGPMARTVADAAVMFRAMKGDAAGTGLTAVQLAARRRAEDGASSVFPKPYFWRAARSRGARRRWRERSRRSAVRDTTSGPSTSSTPRERPTSTCTSCCRKPRGITRRRIDAHADRYSPGVRLRLEMGRYILAEDYVRAMFLRSVLTRAVRPRA